MFKIFESHPGLVCSLSAKEGGQMKLRGDLILDQTALANRRRFFDGLGIRESQVTCANLIHGSKVLLVDSRNQGMMMVKTDGLVAGEKNLFLSLTVADCLPVFFFDPIKEAVGLVHAGWKGLDNGILAAAVEEFKSGFSSNLADILVGIGPGIEPCHFEVQRDVLERFREFQAEALVGREDKTFLDLKKVARLQLIKLGLKEENIETNPECTFCLKDKYFSARRDKLKKIEAMAAVIGLKA